MAGTVTLLGRPAIETASGRHQPRPGKTSALLYYLAYQDGWVDREDLVYLFWPDTDEHRARQNLRPLLTRLRRLDYAADLEITPTRLRWGVDTDVRAFREALRENQPSRAFERYRGGLLDGFRVAGAPEFDSWLELERGDLRRGWRDAALAFAAALAREARHAHAAEILGRVHHADPLDEAVFRGFLGALARAERPREALGAYDAFAALLEREVDGEPDEATRALVDEIRAGRVPDPEGAVTPPAGERRPTPPLPAQATAFVGREAELAQLAARLGEPGFRLLTLVAPGGMGKTRLALEVAGRIASDFGDGARFVPLEGVASPEGVVSAVADAVSFTPFGARDPADQLLDHLAGRSLLLVLDNLEHLVGDLGLVTALLERAPEVTLLATSRERLELHAEWVYDLAGLGVPDAGEGGDSLRRHDAVALFAQAAAHARAEFSLDGNEPAVARICRAVGGMPLAIELAASWLRALGPEEIAAELEGGLDLLETSLRDLPARHRDIRTVFETSWRRLSAAEQAALRALAVFHGGFTREAAREVAGVGVPLLLALANKSFVRREPSGRFSQHPLMWQVLREQASADAGAHPGGTHAETRARHAAYYAAFVQAREPKLESMAAHAVLAELNLEAANIRAAWFWAAERGRDDLLEEAGEGLFRFHHLQRRWDEGQAAFAHAAARLPGGSVARARQLRHLGTLKGLQGDYPGGADDLRESVAVFQERGAVRDEALALFGLALNYVFSAGESRRSAAVWHRCVALFRQVGDAYHLARSLGNYAHYFRDPAERERIIRESVALFREVEGYFGLPLSLHNLARILAQGRGAYREAFDHLDEAVRVERARGMANRLAWWLNWQGRVLRYWGRLDEARDRHREAHAIAEGLEAGFGTWEFDHALYGLGRLALVRGSLDEAAGHLTEALELTRGRPEPSNHAAEIGCALAGVALAEGRLDDAAELCRDALGAFDTEQHATYGAARIHALCRHRLGEVRLAAGDPDGAAEQFAGGLALAREWHLLPAALHLALGFAGLVEHRGDVARAVSLLRVAAEHPAAAFETRAAARARLGALPGSVEGALERGRTPPFEEVIDSLSALARQGDPAGAEGAR